ncbi:hypothetical protein A2348_05480 [Candidatus Uhrbacteria bacterium RIFOXYB12_FULL_58_10]|nr:MAG: hypothetical protein A2348_05480 [Candidatus Uhrbacteria bacterium RIFOXYB12_FULL_58_10]
MSFCPLCETKYAPAQARVLSEQDDTRLIHATCKKCGSATLALVVEGEAGGSTVGLVTDLSYDDVLRFHRGGRVSTDDVIEAHEGLEAPLAEVLHISPPKRRSRAKVSVASRRAA